MPNMFCYTGPPTKRIDDAVADLIDRLKQCKQEQEDKPKNQGAGQLKQQQQVSDSHANSQKLMRLSKLDNSPNDDDSFEITGVNGQGVMMAKKQSLMASEDPQQGQQQQQQQQQGGQPEQQDNASNGHEDGDGINVASRSMSRNDAAAFPNQAGRAHSPLSLLFGRRITEPHGSLLTLGNFIKKAEPQRMTFMHFGR